MEENLPIKENAIVAETFQNYFRSIWIQPKATFKSALVGFLFLSLLSLPALSFGQKIDTLWFNTKWEKADRQSAAFFRVIRQDSQTSFFVKDFFNSGEIQMEGTYSSLDPQIKNGSFTWWYKNGIKKMDAVFRNDTTESYKEYDSEGKIKSQKAYIKVLRYVDGKPTISVAAIDALPEFPGGKDSLNAFIRANLKYPGSAIKKKISGTVIVQFVVTATGKIEGSQLIQSIDPALDREAIRVVKLMPYWVPGVLDGKPIRVSHHLPLKFQL